MVNKKPSTTNIRYLYLGVGILLVFLILFVLAPFIGALLGFNNVRTIYKCGGIAGNICPEGYICINPLHEQNIADGLGNCVSINPFRREFIN